MQLFIEHAPPNSRRIKWFTRMSKGASYCPRRGVSMRAQSWRR